MVKKTALQKVCGCRKKNLGWLGLLAVLLLLGFLEVKNEGFRSSKIYFRSPDGDYSNHLEGLEKIFKQPFSYLGKGRQAFVFLSADGKYVVKFFNFHHFYYPGQISYPFLKDKTGRLKLTFSSYGLAFDRLREETGLLGLHLRQDGRFQKKLQVKGPLGQSFVIDLGRTYFVVQKKVEPLKSCFFRLKGQGQLEAGIEAFLQTVLTRLQKGIVDQDLDGVKNYGFLDGRAVNFDAGRFSFQELSQEALAKELGRSSRKLLRWLQKEGFQESGYLERRLAELAFQNR
ncbi:MAG: hypothetical protein WC371_04325 [Parachlamydiales bacterium]